jgi:AmmeMemoRadiSam system protein A
MIPDLKIVPIYTGEQSRDNIEALAGALGKYLAGRNILVVFSTDLSHFHPYETAVQMDQKVIRMIEQGGVSELAQASQEGGVEACGLGPVCVSLFLAKKIGWNGPSLIRYANSGDVTGDRRSVVGYAAMAFTRSRGLKIEDQKAILDYAHAVLKAKLQNKPEPKFSVASSALDEKRGIFVTLKEHGRLRGCIGQILGQKPLRESIREMTLAAAFEDSRFPPVALDELKDIKMHISFLTQPVPVKSYQDIRIGTDGIIVSHGWKKGVYLPEVATETGWDAREFFTSCALEKAGIGQQDLDQTAIETFQTEGFED